MHFLMYYVTLQIVFLHYSGGNKIENMCVFNDKALPTLQFPYKIPMSRT